MAFLEQPTFFNRKEWSAYIACEKMTLLDVLKEHAELHNLKSKHLYRDFQGIFAQGNLSLLQKPKIAIIGTRRPNQYAKQTTAQLATMLANHGFAILSGGAIGIDCIAHQHVKNNAIMILPCGINICYPKENAGLIANVRQSGLLLSEYIQDHKPMKHSFLERNRLIIAWSDIVIIPQADLQSGSSSSANLALTLEKPLFVFPHRLHESLGTQALLQKQKAQCIYNIESFVKEICALYNINHTQEANDPIIEFAHTNGLFEEALRRFGDIVFTYELEGKIKRNGLYIAPC